MTSRIRRLAHGAGTAQNGPHMTAPAVREQSLRSFALPLALLFLCMLINYVDRGNVSTAGPLLKTEFRLSASQLGILFAAFFYSYTVMQFVYVWLVDRL